MPSKEVKAGAAFVELIVRDNKLSAGLRAASKRIRAWAVSTKKYLQGIGKSMSGAGMWGLGISSVLGGGMVAMTKSFADTGGKLADMSHRTGMSTEALSELGYAAQLCGSDIGTLEGSVHKMQKLMLDAAQGSQGAIDKLGALGLSYKKLARLSPEDQFAVIIDRLGKMDEATRAAHAMEIFGKSAHQLMPMINAGAAGIADMRAEARQLGMSMSGEDAAAADELDDALTRLQSSFKSIVMHIGAALAPEITALANWIAKSTHNVIAFIQQNKGLIVSFAKWTAIIAGVSAGLIVLGAVFTGLGTVAGVALGAVAISLKIVAGLVAFLCSPLGLVVAGFGLLLWATGALGDMCEWLQGCFSSLFSTASKAWGGICNAIAAGRFDLAMKVAWTGVKLVWQDGINFIYKWWLWLQKGLLNLWDGTIHGLITAWHGFRLFMNDMYFGVQAAWVICVNAIKKTWNGLIDSIVESVAWVVMKIETGLARLYGLKSTATSIEEDYKKKKNARNAAKVLRQADYDAQLAAVGQKSMDANNAVRKTHGYYDDAYNEKINNRQARYDGELADMQEKRLQAEQEFNDAVAEAGAARIAFEDPGFQQQVRQIPSLQDDEADIEDVQEEAVSAVKHSAAGTFNAAEIQSLQSSGPMDEIAKNTADTAKYVKKISQKDMTAVAG